MMDDWETADVPVKAVGNWDDEEEEIPESWDVTEKPKETKPKPSAPLKKSAKEKMAEKLKKKEKIIEDFRKAETESKPMTEREREELSKQQECSLIMDSFGVTEVPIPTSADIDFSKVNSKQDFDDLLNKLSEKFRKLEGSPYYSAFAEELTRRLCIPMELDNLKEVSTTVNALVSEKQKQSKTKGKKKGKAKLVVERSAIDVDYEDVGDAVDDYDDFI